MTVYRDIMQLAAASFEAIPDDFISTDETRRLGKLVAVYFDALHNPPEGIIGVGAITYAEQCLVAAQA